MKNKAEFFRQKSPDIIPTGKKVVFVRVKQDKVVHIAGVVADF
jgi:hypothetical protein